MANEAKDGGLSISLALRAVGGIVALLGGLVCSYSCAAWTSGESNPFEHFRGGVLAFWIGVLIFGVGRFAKEISE